jgi:hypothetical protein
MDDASFGKDIGFEAFFRTGFFRARSFFDMIRHHRATSHHGSSR